MLEAIDLARKAHGATRANLLISEINEVSDGEEPCAYIFNYANGQGFDIVSTSRAVTPILAFSEEGSFSTENEPAMLYFVNNIKNYTLAKEMDFNETGRPERDYDLNSFSGGWIEYPPTIKINLWQEAPFNVKLQKEYPNVKNIKAGCGPVSAAMTMVYCKSGLIWQGYEYDFKSMIELLNMGPGGAFYDSADNPNIIPFNPPIRFMLTYDGTLAAFNQLLYDLGKSMHSEYLDGETSTHIDSLVKTIKNAGYSISERNIYDAKKIREQIETKHIVIQSGREIDDFKKGHFWVMDGFRYYDFNIENSQECYFFCHWGWRDYPNGYYYGPVFAYSPGDTYYAYDYVSVQIGPLVGTIE